VLDLAKQYRGIEKGYFLNVYSPLGGGGNTLKLMIKHNSRAVIVPGTTIGRPIYYRNSAVIPSEPEGFPSVAVIRGDHHDRNRWKALGSIMRSW